MIKDEGLTIKVSNLREGKFYWRGLVAEGLTLSPEPQKIDEYYRVINHAIQRRYPAAERRRDYINVMRSSAANNLLPPSELEWLDKGSERMHFWIWCYCRLIANQGTPSFAPKDSKNLNEQLLPDNKLELDEHPRTTKERYNLIISFLDRSNAPIELKRSLVQQWKKEWEETYSTEKFLWVDNKDTTQCDWFANYISSNDEFQIPNWFIPIPTTPQEKYDAGIAAFDIWPTDQNTKKLFIIRMKKAWSQKKHRLAMKKKDKQSYNFTLSASTKKMLDEMADHANLSRNEYLEKILVAEYNRAKG